MNVQKILQIMSWLVKTGKAYAHCDIPCGIYDPHRAQLDALTVVRMDQLINKLDKNDEGYSHHLTRYTAVKEEHAEDCKNQIRIIWGDYMKQEILDKYPQINGLVHQIMQQASESRQGHNIETATKLLSLVNEFAKIFWESKNMETKVVTSPYEPKMDVVYPKL